MKKNRLYSFLTICVMAMMLTACEKKEEVVDVVEETEEVNMFGLTEEQQKLYAEYAAGVLMKYNAGTNTRVLEGQKLIQTEEKEEAKRQQELRREQLAQEYANNKETAESDKKDSASGNGGSNTATGVSYISDMATASGMNNFSITYIGCEITDSYPSEGEDILMAMDATRGKVLVVAKFAVTNKSSNTENFNMFSNQGKFKLKLNGKSYKSQYTLLLNDLSMYKGDLEAGETIETVLVFEIPQDQTQNVNDMELAITIGGDSSYMSMSGSAHVSTDYQEGTEDVEEELDSVAETDSDNADVEETEISEGETEDVEIQMQSDLAQEYMEALEALEEGMEYEGSVDTSNNNVTIVGSKKN